MSTPARSAPRRRGSGWRFVRDLVVMVIVALIASFLIKTFLIRSFYIPSASMENTLIGGADHQDRILVDELVPDLVPLQRGDVVVFSDPGGWIDGGQQPSNTPQTPLAAAADWMLTLVGLSAQDSNDHLVKRVIGLPGDHVTCCDGLGQMSVNGIPLDEPYVRIPTGSTAVSRDPFDVTVGAGDVWVMGDNRYDSADSRFHQSSSTHGGVPVKDIVGRAFVISWPVDRWSWLSDYPPTFAGIPAASGSH